VNGKFLGVVLDNVGNGESYARLVMVIRNNYHKNTYHSCP